MEDSIEPGSGEKKKIYFPNLDGLRFFSFLLVFFSHSFATDYKHIKDAEWYRTFKGTLFSDGDLGVSFFFVLSGFLITYLLLKEKEYTGSIHVKAFYIRRALRIWPLYYFAVFFGFFIFPYLKSMFGQPPAETADPILSSLFLNNFDRIINGPPDSSVLAVLWSVAIEEQFYLVWPLLFLLVPSSRYIWLFIGVILLSLSYRIINYGGMIDIHSLGVISDMAIGGLGAYLSINSPAFLARIGTSPRFVNAIPYILTLLILVFKKDFLTIPFFVVTYRVFTSAVFIWIILEQNFAKHSLFKISNLKLISTLGRYTYGMYCLHTIAILFVLTVLNKFGLNKETWQLWLIEFPLSLLLSILIAWLSYEFMEKHFLKLKNRFAFITR